MELVNVRNLDVCPPGKAILVSRDERPAVRDIMLECDEHDATAMDGQGATHYYIVLEEELEDEIVHDCREDFGIRSILRRRSH